MPVPQMPPSAVITLVDAIAVYAVAEGRGLMGDQDGGWDGVEIINGDHLHLANTLLVHGSAFYNITEAATGNVRDDDNE